VTVRIDACHKEGRYVFFPPGKLANEAVPYAFLWEIKGFGGNGIYTKLLTKPANDFGRGLYIPEVPHTTSITDFWNKLASGVEAATGQHRDDLRALQGGEQMVQLLSPDEFYISLRATPQLGACLKLAKVLNNLGWGPTFIERPWGPPSLQKAAVFKEFKP
jgi:hypothetical protein